MNTAMKVVGVILGGVVMFFFGLTVGMMPSHSTTTTVAAPAPIAAQTPAPAPATTQAGVTHPLVGFSDGTYEVGLGDGQIYPGKYKVAASTGPMGNFYSVRQGEKVIKADYTQGPTFVVLEAGQTVTISGGGQWAISQ